VGHVQIAPLDVGDQHRFRGGRRRRRRAAGVEKVDLSHDFVVDLVSVARHPDRARRVVCLAPDGPDDALSIVVHRPVAVGDDELDALDCERVDRGKVETSGVDVPPDRGEMLGVALDGFDGPLRIEVAGVDDVVRGSHLLSDPRRNPARA